MLTPVRAINAPGAPGVPRVLAGRTTTAHLLAMALGTPRMTFGELASEQLELEVVCPNCNHRRVIDGSAPALREKCGSVGLPELGKQRLWTKRLAKHARKLT